MVNNFMDIKLVKQRVAVLRCGWLDATIKNDFRI
jgi:hypothetical protein